MDRDRIENDYFEWLFELVCGKRYAKDISYRKLLTLLHNTEFTYIIPMDENRASDGISIRNRFLTVNNYRSDSIDRPCSVLEMMVGLAIRCEENIMDDPRLGDRTGQWFWGMINNLGLGAMYDSNFDKRYAIDTIQRFLNRDYEPNGKGGLFTIKKCDEDLRNVEIWHQLCWYLDSIYHI